MSETQAGEDDISVDALDLAYQAIRRGNIDGMYPWRAMAFAAIECQVACSEVKG